MEKISIIVPIYNVENYLDRCIKSILNQTYHNLEIILINDGSTDNSLSICYKYRELDKRVIVIDKKNGGVSSARNAGLEISTGDYVGFVDPDDWIELDMFESMHKNIKKSESDIVMCNYILENRKKIKKMNLNLKKDIYVGEEIIDNIVSNMIAPSSLNGKDIFIMGYVWRLLIKREIISGNKIVFDESIHLAEDLLFCINLFLNTNQVFIEKNYNYHYFMRTDSTLNKYRKEQMKECEKLDNEIIKLLDKYNLTDTLENKIFIRQYLFYFWNIENIMKRDSDFTYSKKINFIKQFCNDDKVKYIISNDNTETYTLKKKIYMLFIKNKMYISIYMYHKICRIWRMIRRIV